MRSSPAPARLPSRRTCSGLTRQLRLSSKQMGRRRLLLGHQHDGQPLHLAIRGRTVLIAGEPGSGKSWLAGLLCEQLILQGYCLCIIDPEGDYRSLEALPGVVVMGGDDPPPRARELTQALRYPDTSVVIDLSKLPHQEKQEYLRELLPLLATLRRQTGLPHKILIDEAHYYLGEPRRAASRRCRAGRIHPGHLSRVRHRSARVRRRRHRRDRDARNGRAGAGDAARHVRRHAPAACRKGSFRISASAKRRCCRARRNRTAPMRRFQIAPRLTSHVRHRTKYLDMPIAEPQAFVFTSDGGPGPRARDR